MGWDRPAMAPIDALLSSAGRGRPGALVLRGEPGIGKTTVLGQVVQRLAGWRVLRATGIEGERQLEQAGLVSLFAPLAPTAGDGAPPRSPHADPLAELLRGGRPASTLDLGVAVLQRVSTLAAHQPVAIVLDDAHWLDETTVSALRFAFHRLDGDRVAVVAAVRSGEPSGFDDLPAVVLDGVDVATAAELLGESGPVADAVVVACHHACHGNPLALREVGRNLTPAQRLGTAPLPHTLPIGEALQRALARRVRLLPEPSRRALLVAALAGREQLSTLSVALEQLGRSTADLDAAEAAGLIVRSEGAVSFLHPLVRTATVADAGPSERRAAHRALAMATEGDGDDRYAWHLAEAADGADPHAVAALVEVAERARANAAHTAAAAAWDRAAQLTTNPAERARYLLASGIAHASTDVLGEALPRLRRAWETAPSPVLRAHAALALGDVTGWLVSVEDALRLLHDDAGRVEGDTPELAVQLLAAAATFAGLAGQLNRATDLAARAETVAARCDELTQAAARLVATHSRLVHGEAGALGERLDELDVAAAFITPSAPDELLQLGQLVGFDWMVLERWPDALRLLDAVAAGGRRLAFVGTEVFALAMRGEVLWRMGRWSEARAESLPDHAHNQSRPTPSGSFGGATLARVEAALGLVDDARAHAAAAAARGDSVGMGVLSAWGRHAEGLAWLADGRPDLAVAPLEWVWRLSRRGGIEEPGPLWWQGDLLEAFAVTGRAADARRLVAQLEREAAATGRRWAVAVAARGRALLDGDRGSAERSVRTLDALGAPFEAARSRLVLATLQDGAARRATLLGALDAFERLGAAHWEAQARSALGLPASRAGVALAAALTEGELRVALAVGRGLTNRQAATRLQVSPKTVDAHLQSIYRKLHLRSRTELALLVARQGVADAVTAESDATAIGGAAAG